MTIYEEIGGAPSVAAAVDAFYIRVLDDPGLAPYFEGIDVGKLKGHQRAFIGAALGGAEAYEGRGMAAAHAPFNITDGDFDAVVGHLVAVLDELGVPSPTIATIGEAIAPLRSEIVSG